MVSQHDQANAIEKSEEIRWMGLALKVPADWAIRRHGLSPQEGHLILADRRAQRMELHWQRPGKAPDEARTVQHGIERLRKEQPEAKVTQMPRNTGWTGFVYGREPRLYRGVFYEPAHNVLLQVSLSLPGDRAATNQVARSVLRSVVVVEPPDRASNWKAFGISCTVPPHWKLSSAQVYPMDVRFKFDCGKISRLRKTRTTCQIRRIGMAEDWFDGDLRAFAQTQAVGRATSVTATETREAGEVIQIESSCPRFFFLGRCGPLDRRSLRVWRNRPDNSIFILALDNPRHARASLDQINVPANPPPPVRQEEPAHLS